MNGNRYLLGVLLVAAGIACCGAPSSAATSTTEYRGLGFQGLGARIGFVDPEGASSTVALGIHVDAGEFVQHVAEYWKVGLAGFDFSDFNVGTDVNVDFPVEGGRVIPYAGGGLGLHFVKESDPAFPNASLSDTKLGFNIQGGIRNQAMPNLGVFGEVKYSFVSDVNSLKIMGGFTYNFIY